MGLDASIYGIQPIEFIGVSVRAIFHHGAGSILMGLGLVTEWTSLWRHGVMVEVGGMDLLDLAQVVYSVCFPPGMEPWATQYSGVATSLLLLHHGCGLLGAFPTCMYFSDEPCFRWAAFLLMAGPFPMLVLLVVDAIYDHTTIRGAWIHILISGTNFFLTYYLRITLLMPVALECIQLAQERGGDSLASFLRGAYACISFINVLIAFTLLKTFFLAVFLEGFYIPENWRRATVEAIQPVLPASVKQLLANFNHLVIAFKLVPPPKTSVSSS